jgi:hypothetical protein
MESSGRGDVVQSPVIAVLDVLGKIVLLAFLIVVVIDPAWGNLAGKAPTARALTYPLMAFAIPLWWVARRPDSPYPWLPDLLLTFIGFSDILGNRLDLYDRVVWFDDWIHFMNTTCVAAALVLITMHRAVDLLPVLERSVALGMTAALGWELFEYFSFLTHSSELPTAYGDTIGDLVMGWFGSIAAGLLIHFFWRSHMPMPRPGEGHRGSNGVTRDRRVNSPQVLQTPRVERRSSTGEPAPLG